MNVIIDPELGEGKYHEKTKRLWVIPYQNRHTALKQILFDNEYFADELDFLVDMGIPSPYLLEDKIILLEKEEGEWSCLGEMIEELDGILSSDETLVISLSKILFDGYSLEDVADFVATTINQSWVYKPETLVITL